MPLCGPPPYPPAVRSRFVVLFHLLGVILLQLLPRAALANMAKPSERGEVAGVLEPETVGGVRVDRETLTFEVYQDLSAATVKAVYRMTSTAATPLSFDVAFVHVRAEHEREDHRLPPSILADDQPVSFRSERAGKQVEGWSELGGPQDLVFLRFHLDFAPGQTRTVRVEYTQDAGWDRVANVNMTSTFDYLLSPAKHWASFGPLEIQVHVPPGTRLTSPTTAFTRQGDLHTAAFATLPPGELTFSVMSTQGLWFGLASTGAYWNILLVMLVAAVLGIGAATGRLWQRPGWKGALSRIFGASALGTGGSAVLLIAALLAFPGRGLGYGGVLGGFALVLLAGPACVVVSFIAAGIRARRADR